MYTYIYIYIYTYISISLSLSIYIYIYIRYGFAERPFLLCASTDLGPRRLTWPMLRPPWCSTSITTTSITTTSITTTSTTMVTTRRPAARAREATRARSPQRRTFRIEREPGIEVDGFGRVPEPARGFERKRVEGRFDPARSSIQQLF